MAVKTERERIELGHFISEPYFALFFFVIRLLK